MDQLFSYYYHHFHLYLASSKKNWAKQSDAYNSTVKFLNLSKSDRDAVVKFIRSI